MGGNSRLDKAGLRIGAQTIYRLNNTGSQGGEHTNSRLNKTELQIRE